MDRLAHARNNILRIHRLWIECVGIEIIVRTLTSHGHRYLDYDPVATDISWIQATVVVVVHLAIRWHGCSHPLLRRWPKQVIITKALRSVAVHEAAVLIVIKISLRLRQSLILGNGAGQHCAWTHGAITIKIIQHNVCFQTNLSCFSKCCLTLSWLSDGSGCRNFLTELLHCRGHGA